MQMTEVYMPLLDEGTSVWRPVWAESLAGSTFRIVANQPCDTDDEHWEFPPGSVVRCCPQALSDGTFLTAFELVHPPTDA